MDYRIKTCVICDKYADPATEDQNISHNPAPPHTCYKNWTDSSQSMEADIIVEGFRKSLPDHGLIYRYLVGDADSSVYAKIQSQVVYPGRLPVEKIDCINHAVRGLNSKLYSIVNSTGYAKEDRDLIQSVINRYRLCSPMYFELWSNDYLSMLLDLVRTSKRPSTITSRTGNGNPILQPH